jgi:hypothetical protein
MANRLLSEWIVLSVEAFTAAENPAFQRFATHLRPGYGAKLPKGDAAKNHVVSEFEAAQKRFATYLEASLIVT